MTKIMVPLLILFALGIGLSNPLLGIGMAVFISIAGMLGRKMDDKVEETHAEYEAMTGEEVKDPANGCFSFIVILVVAAFAVAALMVGFGYEP